jgi:hypothetical protein
MLPIIAMMILAAGQQPAGGASGKPCVPDGKTTNPQFNRPPLGGPGDPVGAEWVDRGSSESDNSGDPQAFESDGLSGDDAMGDAAPSADGGKAEVPVTNDGGDLSGPDGEDQNGGVEGKCIEVYVEWTYRYPVEIRRSKGVSLWGYSYSETVITIVWKEGKKRSKVKEICPC